MRGFFKGACAIGLVLSSLPVLAEASARALLDKARESFASAPVFRRVDTSEQSAVVTMGQRRAEQLLHTNVVTIEIDMSKLLARQTATVGGKQLVMLKQGEKAAMKLGTGPWQIPTGIYANIAKDMGNLFVCEIETPETEHNAPVWKVTGTERLDGHDAIIIETEGNTAAPLAQERMAKGIAKMFSGHAAQQPVVKVLEYSSKHWINRSDYRQLKAVQLSKAQLTIALPDGTQQLIEQSSRATSRYDYNQVTIEVPADAQKILSGKDRH